MPALCTLQAVTPDNFLAVLKGDSASTKGGSGKVLKRQVIGGGEACWTIS